MKRLVLIGAVLLLISAVLPAAAQDDARTLAQYFPGDAPFYIEVRTDDDFLQTIDSLVAKIVALVPDAQTGESFMEMIDEGIRDEIDPDGSFATTIRPWLGDAAGLGILSFDEEALNSDQAPMLLAIAITDADAAAEFFTQAEAIDDYAVEAGDGFTLYSPDGGNPDEPFVVIRSDVLIITTDATIAQAGGVITASLSENPIFGSTLDALPLESYDASAYLDTPTFFNAIAREDSNAEDWAMIEPMLAAIQPSAFGFVVQDGRALVFDAASPLNPDAELPFPMPVTEPLDPAFARHIPANTALVVQGTNLYQSYEYGIQSLRQLAETMSQNSDDFDTQDLNAALFGINFAVRGITGMDVEDAFGWMTGDYALALGLSSSFADSRSVMAATSSLPVDFAIILEATDGDAVQSLFAGLSESVSELEADNVETEVSADTLRLTFTPEDIPFPIELVISKNDDVFVIGTERMVRAALDPQNGMDSDAAFTEAGGYSLDGANALLYVGSSGLTPLARVMSATDNPLSVQQQGKEVKAALELFDSVTITSAALPDNPGSVMRFVWLLPE